MEQYSLHGVLRAKGLIKNIKLKSRLPVILLSAYSDHAYSVSEKYYKNP